MCSDRRACECVPLTNQRKNIMQDKNGQEIKKGDIVKIENAFSGSSNGRYLVDFCPGDAGWLGNFVSLVKLTKKNTVSVSKYKIASWPLACYATSREYRNAAKQHNAQHATIEVVGTMCETA